MFKQRVKFLPPHAVASGLLPWVIAVMVYLTGLALATGLALNGVVSNWTTSLAQGFTVQIITKDPAEARIQAQKSHAFLMQNPAIASAKILNDTELAALLEPWLGVSNIGEDLPVPRMIEVETKAGLALDIANLQRDLATIAPDATIDTYGQWITPLIGLVRSVQIIATSIIVLVALATIAIIIFAVRTGLATHHEIIEVLHLIGARDNLIANEFQYRFMILGLRGGIIGLAALIPSWLLLVQLTNNLDAAFIPQLILSIGAIVTLASLPLLAALLALVVARITVLQALGAMV